MVLILAYVVLAGLAADAQDVRTVVRDVHNDGSEPQTEVHGMGELPTVAVCPDESVLDVRSVHNEMREDSLHIPTLNRFGQVPIGIYPTGWMGWNNWELHEGLNVNIGASVFGAFGKNAPKGAGFGQSVSAMYAIPINSRLSLAVGGT